MTRTIRLILSCACPFLVLCFSCHYSMQRPTTVSEAFPKDYPLRYLKEESQEGEMPSSLAEALKKAQERDRFKILFDFNEQLDLIEVTKILRKKNLKKIQRREFVIKALRAVSEKKEKEIKPLLESLMINGDLEYYKKISIVNRLYVVANARAILQLAQREDVARMYQEYNSFEKRSGRQIAKMEIVPLKKFTGDSWAIPMMGAEQAWKLGYDGKGVVIGSIDTGIWPFHEQLKDNFRGGENSWFDPVTGSKEPFDSKGHGTGVLSCALGTNKNNKIVGVAKGSRWIAALANHRNYYNNIQMTLCADWMLNVGRPDVIVNAWSHGAKECYAFDLEFISAWKAAEMFPVFAAGNRGPSTASGESPAELSGTFPDDSPVFSVGSINSEGNISSFSSRGPSRCGGFIFPIIVAPGEEVPFVLPSEPDAYMVYSGTSSAAGFAAGAIAILVQKYPEMSVQELENLVKERAIDKGPPGPDNDFGFGLLYLPALLQD